jgi:hypothetical protein
VSLKKAVKMTPHLQNAWAQGLGALRAQDRPHVATEDPRHLTGSVDVDNALKTSQPNAHRWDYAIGYLHSNKKECIYWVEIHPARDQEVNVVLQKLRWLQLWLADSNNPLNQFERDFVWVSSGATSFTLGAPQRKMFAQLGLQHKGKVLRIPNLRQP